MLQGHILGAGHNSVKHGNRRCKQSSPELPPDGAVVRFEGVFLEAIKVLDSIAKVLEL